jgi:hypothetical protein
MKNEAEKLNPRKLALPSVISIHCRQVSAHTHSREASISIASTITLVLNRRR